ncbi:MAG: hypothetical protein EZS28_004842 [Streblomastix strix]|uniref:Dynein heavy chain n=1 Tax=Streblomastix strix TaxID=222440 RepID=A0A5J4WXV2_9EUKA|nr:MAG: hypothetical protein EZS28_004842 [Streblomastix strix]
MVRQPTLIKSDEEDINPNMKKDTKQGVKPVTDQTDFEVLTKTIFFYDVVCEQVDLFMKLHEKMLPDTETGKLFVWEVQEYKYEAEIPFFYIYIPKLGTVRYSFLTDILIGTYIPTMYVCETGVGKSEIVRDYFAVQSLYSAVLFIDDFIMSNPETFASQPPLELLRQMLSID